MSGAPLITILRKITLPLMRPALLASTLVMIVLGLEAFEVPALLGNANGTWVFTTLIFQSLQNIPANYGNAAAYSLPIVILAMLGIYIQSRMTRRSRAFQTVSGKAYRPRQLDIAWWRWPAAIGAILFLLISTILPFVVLLYASTQSFYSVPSRAALRSMTWSNYSYTFTNDETVGAIKTSLLLGVGAATAVMVLAAVLSWITVRTKTRLRWIVDSLATLPLAIPGVVLGVALLFIYLRFPIAIYGTIWVMFIAYLTRFLPYGMRYASVSMQQLSLELEESAHVSGASWAKTFARITAPLLAPGLVAGWIYILIVSLRELSTIILLYSPNDKTLSIVIWELWQNGQFTDVAALGVVMTVALVVLVGGAQWLSNRVGVAMGGRR